MIESKVHNFRDPKTLADLRKIVEETKDLDAKTTITINKVAGDPREPGYATITINER